MTLAHGKYKEWLMPENLLRLESWARDGLTDEQIASNMGIGYSTLQTWKSKYQDIQDTLKKGKEIVDIQVENALLKRAIGYECIEKRTEVSEKDGKKTVETVRHIAGDVTAQIFWLKNRRPDKYREKPIEKQTETIPDDPISKALKEEFQK